MVGDKPFHCPGVDLPSEVDHIGTESKIVSDDTGHSVCSVCGQLVPIWNESAEAYATRVAWRESSRRGSLSIRTSLYRITFDPRRDQIIIGSTQNRECLVLDRAGIHPVTAAQAS